MEMPLKEIFDKLKVDEVFDWYDMPLIFTCIAPIGQLYFCMSVDEDRDSSSWLYFTISKKRLAEIKNKELDLRSAILLAEDAIITIVKCNANSLKNEFFDLECFRVDEKFLPKKGEYL